MIQTTNYKLNKIELVDSPADITVLNVNWDKIDTELKNLSDNKFDKSGGTISGAVTITGKLTASGGIEVTGNQVVSGNSTVNVLNAQAVTLTNAMPIRSQVAVKKGENPSALTYSHWSIFDNQGYEISTSRLARFQYSVDTNGTAALAMYVNKFNSVGDNDLNGIIIQYGTDGTARVSLTHHPVENSNDKQVATTYWVRNLKATASQYGLVKLADETAILNESDESALTVDKAYELNDFRRMETAYAVGDKVNCTFNFGLFLECTTAGTTSADTLDTRNVMHGQVITDGTCQWTVRTHVKSVNGNVPDASGNITVPTTDANTIKQVVLDTFFPVGSIYMDVTGNVNPNNQFGGTWAKIENRFLYGSGSKGIGATGGAETVTLNTNQIPSHNHSLSGVRSTGGFGTGKTRRTDNVYAEYPAWGVFSKTGTAVNTSNGAESTGREVNFDISRSVSGTSGNQGGGGSHENMPPYVVVAIWKRTA